MGQAEGTDSSDRPFNNLLRRLNASDFALIEPNLAREEVGADEPLEIPATMSRSFIFPADRVWRTYLVSNEDGRDVETILVGREGAVGGIGSEGPPACARIVVKFGGPFGAAGCGKLDAAKTKSATLRNVFARYRR